MLMLTDSKTADATHVSQANMADGRSTAFESTIYDYAEDDLFGSPHEDNPNHLAHP